MLDIGVKLMAAATAQGSATVQQTPQGAGDCPNRKTISSYRAEHYRMPVLATISGLAAQ